MFLWLSIDDLYWADETRTIPQSVLEADDDLTWRQFRNGQKDEKTVADNTQAAGSGNGGYTRPSTMGTEEEEDELSWSELKDKYGNGQGRYLRVNDSSNGQQQSRRKEQEAGVTFLTPWEELPFSKQISASVLGHDATSWNSGQPVFTDTMSWDQLTTEQQEAAVSLGYDQVRLGLSLTRPVVCFHVISLTWRIVFLGFVGHAPRVRLKQCICRRFQ